MGLIGMVARDAFRAAQREGRANKKRAAQQKAAARRAKQFPATVALERIAQIERGQAVAAQLARQEQAARAELARRGIYL